MSDVAQALAAVRRALDLPSGIGSWGRVAVLAGPEIALPEAREVVWSPVAEPAQMHAQLTAHGPFDVLLDLAGAGLDDRFEFTAPHVRAGGRYAAQAPAAETEELLAWLARVGTREPPDDPKRARAAASRRALAQSLEVHLREGVIVGTRTTPVVAKVRERDADEVLAVHPGTDVLVTVPGSAPPEHGAIVWSAPHPLQAESFSPPDAPPLALRRYDDAVALGRQAAVTGDLILPESFRDPGRRWLQTPVLDDVGRYFARRPDPPAETLVGARFLLDTHMPGHFGHALTEQLAHVWAWPEAVRRAPGLRGLLLTAPGGTVPKWTWELLEAAGVPRDLVDVRDRPVAVRSLLASSPAYVIGGYAHPRIVDTWRAVGRNLLARAPATRSGEPWPRRVFLTRRGEKRAARDRPEVEAYFAARGFTVVAPEELPLPEQVALVSHAEVVAGFAGSQMFTLALRETPTRIVLITSDTYPARNETAIARLGGHRLHVLVCPAEVTRGDDFSTAAFHSAFAVDLAGAGGRFLDAALA